MRRKDREITDKQKIEQIMEDSMVCRLGLYDGKEVYIVPLNFGYEEGAEGSYTLYFHSAAEGRKIEILKSNPHASFEMDSKFFSEKNEIACRSDAGYQSIMGTGTVSFVTDFEEKRKALSLLMDHTCGKGTPWQFQEASIRNVTVFSLKVESLSAKSNML